MTEYLSRNRPKLNIETLLAYKPRKLEQEPNPWLDVIKVALSKEDEPHVLKVIRTLIKMEQDFGPREDNLYLKVAQLTVEGYDKYGWSFNGLGWEEEWRDGATDEKS